MNIQPFLRMPDDELIRRIENDEMLISRMKSARYLIELGMNEGQVALDRQDKRVKELEQEKRMKEVLLIKRQLKDMGVE